MYKNIWNKVHETRSYDPEDSLMDMRLSKGYVGDKEFDLPAIVTSK